MGYYARYEGEIMITPPLTHADLKDWEAVEAADRDGFDIKTTIVEVRTETDDGLLIRRTGTHVTAATDASFKGYNLENNLRLLVSTFPDRLYDGRIEAVGEDGDRWAFRVRAGEVEEIRPEIVWPA
jgi:hypothetical protein